jgi:hypothetical protein
VLQIDEAGWRQIASNPDLGELISGKQEPVDFAVWQAADGTWQLWSCIRNTKEAGVTRLLHSWEGRTLFAKDWQTILAKNPCVRFFNGERGYVRCTVTPREWRSDFRTVAYVSRPGAPIITRETYLVESGRPGAELT